MGECAREEKREGGMEGKGKERVRKGQEARDQKESSKKKNVYAERQASKGLFSAVFMLLRSINEKNESSQRSGRVKSEMAHGRGRDRQSLQ